MRLMKPLSVFVCVCVWLGGGVPICRAAAVFSITLKKSTDHSLTSLLPPLLSTNHSPLQCRSKLFHHTVVQFSPASQLYFPTSVVHHLTSSLARQNQNQMDVSFVSLWFKWQALFSMPKHTIILLVPQFYKFDCSFSDATFWVVTLAECLYSFHLFSMTGSSLLSWLKKIKLLSLFMQEWTWLLLPYMGPPSSWAPDISRTIRTNGKLQEA